MRSVTKTPGTTALHRLSVWPRYVWRFCLRSLLAMITTLGFVSLVFAQTSAHLRGTNTGGGTTSPAFPSTTGGYVIHTFTSNGTFTPPPGVTAVDVLIIGGGGGGGRGDGSTAGGGGGGGDMRELTGITVTPSSAVNVTVGGGGAGRTGSAGAGSPGGASSFGTNTAVGGGGGGAGATTAAGAVGGNGGSGGGGGSGDNNGENGAGGSSTAATTQGAGGSGNGRNNGGQRAGGGGGGATLGAAGDGGVASNSLGGPVDPAGPAVIWAHRSPMPAVAAALVRQPVPAAPAVAPLVLMQAAPPTRQPIPVPVPAVREAAMAVTAARVSSLSAICRRSWTWCRSRH